jgi:hypothetical protein
MKTYEFEYLSDAKLSNCRTNCFTSAIELKEGDCVVIEKEGRGIFLGRIIRVSDEYFYDTDYKYIGDAGKAVAAYIDALEKEKRRAEIANELEERIANLDKERKFEYYATLDESFGELYKECRGLC